MSAGIGAITTHPFDALPPWAALLMLAAYLALGVGAGLLYFHGLWWNTRRLVDGAPALTVIALMLGRYALLAALLALVGRQAGALPLLLTALGIVAARYLAVRRIRTGAA